MVMADLGKPPESIGLAAPLAPDLIKLDFRADSLGLVPPSLELVLVELGGLVTFAESMLGFEPTFILLTPNFGTVVLLIEIYYFSFESLDDLDFNSKSVTFYLSLVSF